MKRIQKIVSIVLLAVLVTCTFAIPCYAEEKTSNRFNVVFVLDASGSMEYTDPDNLRYDATKLFLGLLANDGNYVGSVIFSTDIINAVNVGAVNGVSDKNRIEDEIEGSEIGGWTAIGTALDKAVTMLDDNGDPSLQSVIILLSDGKSEVGNEEDLKNCNDLKAKAINNARSRGVKIYTVGLNSNGGADMDELRQIANATSGECEEVKSAADLKNVFAKFYTLIYSTATTTIFEGNVPSDGKISEKFNVPGAGVEEVNIIISTNSAMRNLRMEKPDGTKLSVEDVDKMTTVSKSFSITKITNPEGGEWRLDAEGTAGDYIKIDMVYNDCLSISAECSKAGDYKIGDKAEVKGYLYNNGELASEGYNDYHATLFVTKKTTDREEDNVAVEYEMAAGDSSYVIEVPLDELGTYSMYMQVVGNGIEKKTDDSPIVINVGNTAPTVNTELIEKHFWVIPFFTKTGDVDLGGAVSDVEDAVLSYSISSSSFKDTSYELNGETLTMTDFYDLSEGSFTVKATDSNGASAEFEVNITTTNVGIVALIVAGIIAVLVIAIIVFLAWWFGNKRFLGSCYVSTFNYEAYEPCEEVMKKQRSGRIPLTKFDLKVPGFPLNKCYLQAEDGKCIYFCSNKPVCVNGKMSKKIKVDHMDTVEIRKSPDAQAGLKVRFESANI